VLQPDARLSVPAKRGGYAADVELIDHAPRVRMFKLDRPEFVCWDLAQYQHIPDAAMGEGDDWYVAICLAGEAGLRVGEIRGLRWREDVDLVAGTITINQQTRRGITGTPKGRTRRTVPMTSTLLAALKRLSVVRAGFALRDADGADLPSSRSTRARLARSPSRHAAMFGVNPWKLMTWMGQKRIDETMLYVNFAGNHLRQLPREIITAPGSELDPDRRIVAKLGARGTVVALEGGAEKEVERLQELN
jgi:integrase